MSATMPEYDSELHLTERIGMRDPKAPTPLEVVALLGAIGKVYANRARELAKIETAIKSRLDAGKMPTVEQLHRVAYLANIGVGEASSDDRDDLLGESQTALWFATRVMAGADDMSS
jgi:hypothetical protein